MLKAISDSFLALLYPQTCRNCGDISEQSAEGVSCSTCWRETRIFTGNETLCGKCGTFLRDTPTEIEILCHHCDAHFYDRAAAVGMYEKALAGEIIHLKTTPQLSQTARLLIYEAVNKFPFIDITRIIPVPLSRKRQLERGFNQAAILAGIIARQTGIPLDEESLKRKVHTPVHRAAMDRKARDLTVRNTFEITRPASIKGENILLVDDVLTSGATVSYCAKVLKKSGAGRVYVFTLARAV